jgi:Domain of unknown function (DUF4864)
VRYVSFLNIMERETPIMTRFLAALALFLALAVPARAQDAGAIESIIADQLQAFNDRDVETAFGFASPTIQGIFGNPGNFGLMVENGYPMVWTNEGAEFLDLIVEGALILQKVRITDADGIRHVLGYAMIDTPDGWRIDGVAIIPAPDVGV